MAYINYMGGLRKEIHHIKVGDGETYEPAMVIFKENMLRQSFIITLDAMWKYLDPRDNIDAMPTDREEFAGIVTRIDQAMRRTYPKSIARARAEAELACCLVAQTFAKGMEMLLTTSWNLAKILQMFEITPCAQAAAQLLMWIQDGLEDMKNFPEHPEPEGTVTAGEVTLFEGSRKVSTREITMTETDLIVESQE